MLKLEIAAVPSNASAGLMNRRRRGFKVILMKLVVSGCGTLETNRRDITGEWKTSVLVLVE